jgi:tetratricopeptide (TPR) repeat protein
MLLTWCQSYRQQNWPKETPDYVLAHYAQHLVEAEEREALYALISKRWLALKIARTYSYHPFAEDVNLAIQIAKSEAPPNWVQLIRNCLTYATFISLAYFVPPTALGVLIRLGQTSRALGYAALMENLEHQSRAYNSIGQAFLARGEREEAITILKQALEKIEVIDEFTKVKELSDVIRTAVQARDKTILVYALAIAKEIRDEEYQLKGIYNVLQAFIEIREFEEALKAVEIIKDGQIRDTLRQMVQAAKLGLTKERKIRTADDINIRDKLSTSSHASQILTHVRELDRILAIINVIPDEENKAFRLGQLAHTLAKMSYKVGLEQVLAIVQSIKNERAKAAGLTRLAQSFVIVKEFDKAVL